MIAKENRSGLIQVIVTAAASAFAFWVIPALDNDVSIPLAVAVLYFFVFVVAVPLLGYLARWPFIRRMIDPERGRFLGRYVSTRSDGKTSIVTIAYRDGSYHLSGHTFDSNSEAPRELGEWSSSALDMHRRTLRYIYEGSHLENGEYFEGSGYARVRFRGSSLAHGCCRFMDDDAAEWRTTEYHKITRADIRGTLAKKELEREDYGAFAQKWYAQHRAAVGAEPPGAIAPPA